MATKIPHMFKLDSYLLPNPLSCTIPMNIPFNPHGKLTTNHSFPPVFFSFSAPRSACERPAEKPWVWAVAACPRRCVPAWPRQSPRRPPNWVVRNHPLYLQDVWLFMVNIKKHIPIIVHSYSLYNVIYWGVRNNLCIIMWAAVGCFFAITMGF